MSNPLVHFELPADDLERAAAFYKETFGWEIDTIDMPEDSATQGEPYHVVRTAPVDENQMPTVPGAINGGLVKRSESGQPVMNYIAVDSIDDALQQVTAHGGTVSVEKKEIGPEMGWYAAFTDPEGNLMGLYQFTAPSN